MDKGTLSNIISGLILITGLILGQWGFDGLAQSIVLSVGMFAFSGGLTNSLAVKMLFDRIPGLIGSGVLQSRFEEIRAEIKHLILEQFFTEEYLREYFHRNAGDIHWVSYLKSKDGRNPLLEIFRTQWERLTSDDVLAPLLKQQVDKIFESSMGGLLSLVGKDTVHGIVSKFVKSFIDAMRGRVEERVETLARDPTALGLELDEEKLIHDIRVQVRQLLEQRLERLTPLQVKHLVEDVIRNHLGWLVVWGNVFGGFAGLVAPFLSR